MVAEESPPRRSVTKMEQAYRRLRRAIVIGELSEGSPLDDTQLTAQLGVGRTPVREAIKRLAQEEFVIWPPHRTPYVRATSAADLNRIYEARHFFELPAARLAAERVTDSEIAELERHCDLFDKAVSEGDLYEVAEHDYNFHLGIAKASHNRFLTGAVGHLNCGCLRLWYDGFVRLGTERVNDDHRRAVEALRRRDQEAAAKVAGEHIEFSHERQLRLHGLQPLQGAASRSVLTTDARSGFAG